MEWLLTREERHDEGYKAIDTDPRAVLASEELVDVQRLGVAKAQAKKLVEWGNSYCTEHYQTHSLHGRRFHMSHFDCPQCMDKLCKEVGLE